jgi:hypothetical protein
MKRLPVFQRMVAGFVAATALAGLPLQSFAQSAFQSDLAVSAKISRKIAQDLNVRQAAFVLAVAASKNANPGADGSPYPLAPLAGTATAIVGGGVIPSTTGAPTTDGFGVPLGYCAWNNGASNSASGLIQVGDAANVGAVTFAVVSPGANNRFDTTCADILTNPAGKGDDYVVAYSSGQILGGVQSPTYFGDPVATGADLTTLAAMPSGATGAPKDGEVRLVKATNALYRFNGASFVPLTGGSSQWNNVNANDIAYMTGSIGVGTSPKTGSGTVIHLLNGANTGTVDSNATVLAQSANRNANFQTLAPNGSGGYQFLNSAGAVAAQVTWAQADGALRLMNSDAAGVVQERVRIDTAGNVGIGTSTPGMTLDVTSSTFYAAIARINAPSTNVTSSNGAGLMLQNTSATPGNYAGIQFIDATGHTQGSMGMMYGAHSGNSQGSFYIEPRIVSTPSAFIVAPSGNVGIGTNNPTSTLTVAGTISTTALKVNGVDVLPGNYVNRLGDIMSGPLGFAATDALNGIYGAANPNDSFVVDTNKVLNHYGLSWKTFSDFTGGPAAALSGYGGVRLYTLGAERVRVTAAGRVGINTSAPAYRLDVNGTIRSIGGALDGGYGLRILNSQNTGGGSVNAYEGASGLNVSSDGGPMVLTTNGIDRVKVNVDGVVDILTNNAVYNPAANAALRIVNSSLAGQSPIDFFMNGALRGRIRSDYAGNLTFVNTNGGNFDWFSGGDSGVGVRTMSLSSAGLLTVSGVQATNFQTTAGEGNGYWFWDGAHNYGTSMGYTPSIYQYGPVSDYSIKTQMDNGSANRGFTWGMAGVKPIAGLSQTGNFMVNGYLSGAGGQFTVDGGGTVVTINNRSSANGIIRLTPNLHLNSYAGNAVIVNWDSGATSAGAQQFRVGNGQGSDVFYVQANGHTEVMQDLHAAGALYADRVFAGYDSGTSGAVSASNWFRSSGASGWYNASYGGGIWMQNSSDVEVYGSKNFRVGTGGGQLLSSQQINAQGNQATGIGTGTGGLGGIMVQGNGSGAAFMSFHRPGVYAAYFGLDTDNQWAVGGWSMGATRYVLLHSGNYSSYSPTLTGGGASGTWGINITGSANYLGGYGYSTGVVGSSITQRDGSGGISAKYILAYPAAGASAYVAYSDSQTAGFAHFTMAGSAVAQLTTSTTAMVLNASMSQPIQLAVGGTTKLQASTAGVQVWGTFTNSSDARLKSDIIQLKNEEMLKKLMLLKPVSYVYKGQDTTSLGFIAQDVQTVLPTLVHQGADGYYSVAYIELVPVLTAAVQAQQKQLEALDKNKLGAEVNKWATSTDKKERMYFEENGRTVVRGHGDIALEVRNAEDAAVATFRRNGDLDVAGILNFSGAVRGGFAFNPTGTLVSSNTPGEIIVNSSKTMRAAVRLQHADDESHLASGRVYGMLFGDETGVGLADAAGKALVTASTDGNGNSSVKVSATLVVGNGTSSSIKLAGDTGINAVGDGSVQIDATSGVRIYNPKTKETVISLGSDGTLQARRFVPTDVVEQNAGCDSAMVGAIARDTSGQPMVCAK